MAKPSRPDLRRLQDALQVLGATRVEATLLAVLREKGPIDTRTILDRTGLRQPEVSVGMRAFRQRGWVETESVPREGKGRPMLKYHLVAKNSEVRSFYEASGRARMEELKHAMGTLKERL